MTLAPGDAVHVKGVGKGTIREMRNGGRCLVEVNGRSILTRADQVTAIEVQTRPVRTAESRRHRAVYEAPSDASRSLDLHGRTVDEAVEAVAAFLNEALLAGSAEVRIIHGRGGGRLEAAVHAQLKRIAAVRTYKVDPANSGVTIVTF